MGPHEDPKLNGESKRPSNMEMHSDADGEDEEGGGEWQIGFEVEMHGIGIDRIIEIGDTTTEENDSDESDSSSERAQNENGYQQLPTTSSTMANAEWLPSTPGLELQPAPPPEELKIEHQPIGIQMDQEKADQIKQIMGKLNIPMAPLLPSNIDDQKLTELVRQLKMADDLKKKKAASEDEKR